MKAIITIILLFILLPVMAQETVIVTKTVKVETIVDGAANSYFTDIEIEVPNPEPTVLIDTIVTMRSIDVENENVKLGGIDHTGTVSYAYVKLQGYGVLKFAADSINNWESVYKFKRTKSIEDTEYKKLGIVPQIREIYFVDYTDTSVRLNISYTHDTSKVECYLNGVLYKEFSPGQFEVKDPLSYNYEQYWSISELERGVDYNITVFVTFLSGDVDSSDTIKLRI